MAMTLSEAVESGSYRDVLLAMQASIAREIDDNPPARDLAALTRRLRDVSAELEGMEPPEESPAARLAAGFQ